MSKSKKYIASGGLAFTEQKDMDKLSRMAEKGWLLDSFAFLGYSLRRDTPRQLAYTVDYNQVAPEDLETYHHMFAASGWTRVCSTQGIHIFSAPKGTMPIYTDRDTRLEKYRTSYNQLKALLIIPVLTLLCLAVLLFKQPSHFPDWIDSTATVAFLVGIVLSVPILMMLTACRIRINRAKRG